jgi:thiol-disulfide isomerase/thioredoxin
MTSIKMLITALLVLLNILTSQPSSAREQFSLIDLNGTIHELNAYQGKWVIVNYWATWCPPCLEEIPDLVNLYDSRKNNDLMVIGVVFDYETLQEVKVYMDDMLMSYPVVLGDNQIAQQIGSAEVLPTTYIYNPEGILVKVKRGIVSRQYIETMIK